MPGPDLKIILIEDESSLRRVIRFNLQEESYQVLDFETADSAWEHLKHDADFSLGIFDIMTPGKLDGLSLCSQLRKNDIHFPVIFLTAKNSLEDKLAGFEAGADDYLTKPFDLEELLVRVKARLKKPSQETDPLKIGPCRVDLSNAMAVHEKSGKTYRFNERENKILSLLIENRGKPVSRDMILDEVWGTAEFPTNRTIDNYIVKFRKIFENDPRNPVYFITRHGTGYELADES
ncbi:MAG: response regulator transcription factor [Spirochaetia bacterium]|nr:response regulator transcription factor [Spirochaetia bacterium]